MNFWHCLNWCSHFMDDLFRVPSDLLGHPEISGLCEATEMELFCRLYESGSEYTPC